MTPTPTLRYDLGFHFGSGEDEENAHNQTAVMYMYLVNAQW